MVKSYLKFEPSKSFGQVCSALSKSVWIPDESLNTSAKSAGAGRAVAGANEDVLVWDIKKGELLSRWSAQDNTAQVTVISQSQVDKDVFAVGYEDGRIRVWDLRTVTVIISFNGHKSGITELQFDSTGARLISGSKDTDIILWDLVSEIGLFKLRGHKDQITSINFLKGVSLDDSLENQATYSEQPDPFLLSTSKDGLIRLWDLRSQHCIEVRVAQSNGECWALGLSPDHSGFITAGNDGELRAWSIDTSALQAWDQKSSDGKILHDRGSFYRHGKGRTASVLFHPKHDLIAIHGSEKAVEFWRIRSEIEVRKTLSRKRKRKREKATEINGDVPLDGDADDITHISTALINEVFVPYVIVRTGGKVRSLAWAGGKSSKSVSILVSDTNNQLEIYNVASSEQKKPKSDEQPEYNRTMSVDMPGHRSDIRCLALSSDDRMLASASQGSLKIWNVRTQSCIRTLDCGYALCISFLPGDKIVVIGTREGTLEIFDISSSTLLDTLKAHESDIWSLQVSPDGKALVTGSADKTAKFWEFKVVQEEVLGTTRKNPKLTLHHTRTIKVADDILSVRFSPDNRLIALSTLEHTVKVFFLDSLKLFLTLYGHKLPVLSMDISYDSKLIVTSSADKNVRVWGLDFGDCHKAFFAHQDSILSVGFVPSNDEGNGHHFFSASKDGMVKYFDGDKFEQIQKLTGHHGEIWALAISHSGEFVVSASHDKSIRIWQQSDEQIFLEEEQEKELEQLYENTLITSLDAQDDLHEANGSTEQAEVVTPGKQTVQTLMAGEKIAEALELGLEDLELMREHESARRSTPKIAVPVRNPVFVANRNVDAPTYVLNVFQKIPSASLQDALLVLSFSQLPSLFTFLAIWAADGRAVPLTCRILFFMVKTHQREIVTSGMMRTSLEEVKTNIRRTLQAQKKELGFNLAALRVLGRRVKESGEEEFVDGEEDQRREKEKDRGLKRGFVTVA